MFDKLAYPETRRGDVVDDFFGTAVADPYRWLEDADDPEVLEWTRVQHELALEALNGLAGRAAFERRLREVWDFPEIRDPTQTRGQAVLHAQ